MGVAACGDIGDSEAGLSLRAGGDGVQAAVAARETGDRSYRGVCAGRGLAGDGVVPVRCVGHGIGRGRRQEVQGRGGACLDYQHHGRCLPFRRGEDDTGGRSYGDGDGGGVGVSSAGGIDDVEGGAGSCGVRGGCDGVVAAVAFNGRETSRICACGVGAGYRVDAVGGVACEVYGAGAALAYLQAGRVGEVYVRGRVDGEGDCGCEGAAACGGVGHDEAGGGWGCGCAGSGCGGVDARARVRVGAGYRQAVVADIGGGFAGDGVGGIVRGVESGVDVYSGAGLDG